MSAPVTYFPDFLFDPNSSFEALRMLDWESRDAPRQEYYCNDINTPYTYGVGEGRRTYSPQPWDSTILAIRTAVEDHLDRHFEVCFLNRYLDQHQHLGWHADDSPEMDDDKPIAIVSLGVAREIWFRRKFWPTGEATQKMVLGHGSLCVMAPGMQEAWQHRIPKASFQCGERISLTFRGYASTDKISTLPPALGSV